GDGIGPEVTASAVRVAHHALMGSGLEVEWIEAPFGNACHLASGSPYPQHAVDLVDEADAVLMGAVGGPDELPPDLPKVEPCLLTLRRQLDAYANLRPIRPHPAVASASPLRAEKLR